MLIILGVGNEAVQEGQKLEVKEAIIKLLQDELGLEVLQKGLKISPGREQIGSDSSGTNELPQKSKYSTRRPMVVIQRLKVTRESLRQWLNRKNSIIR